MNAIVFDQVSKIYPRAAVPAVNNVTLDVPAGRTVVILGTSGSGKTTLLKMVNRIYEPTSGRILVEGTEVHALPVNDLRRRIGYVIQQIGLFPHWTVAQNVATVPRVLGWPAPRIAARVDELLETVGLPPGEFRNRYPSQLSGGQQQRVGIARALAADPQIMLMDEPYGAVDAITRSRLQEDFLTLQARTHKTVLFVTHDVTEALHLADRLIIMDRGQVVQYDTSFNVITHPANEFVAQLIGADDLLRLLELVTVRNVLEPLQPGTVEAAGDDVLHVDDSMSEVLACLLRSQRDVLPVAGDDGAWVGQCSLDKVRESLRRPQSLEPGGEGEAAPDVRPAQSRKQ
ncbi:MAG TPA: ABC transporter ATP-binding protein [Anaerolineae bacterium]